MTVRTHSACAEVASLASATARRLNHNNIPTKAAKIMTAAVILPVQRNSGSWPSDALGLAAAELLELLELPCDRVGASATACHVSRSHLPKERSLASWSYWWKCLMN